MGTLFLLLYSGWMRALSVLWVCFLFVRFFWNDLDVVVVGALQSADEETSRTINDECAATSADTVSDANGDDAASSCRVRSADCSDADVDICFERRNDCDSDPSFMLVHCPKTCQVCVERTLPQNAGFGRIPEETSIHVLQVVRETNLYYQSLNMPDHALRSCHDNSDMCAFWKYQGQCNNPSYRTYMQEECPVTCQLCTLVQARAFLQLLMKDLRDAYNAHGHNHLASRKAALSLLMTTLGIDPSLIGKTVDAPFNWVEGLHSRLHAIIPRALLRLYESPQEVVSEHDLALLSALHVFPSETPSDIVLTNCLVQYRSRGFIVDMMRDVDHLITRPIQLLVGFAVLNDDAIQRLKELSPLLQIGSGSGYWAGILRQHNIDVVAYDLHPPSTKESGNEFFDVAYIDDIQEGGCVESLTPELARDRTLLLIWPNDPDPIDNPQFCRGDGCQGSQAVWDAECLEAFVQSGGYRVAFVGEREAVITRNGDDRGGDSGLSATRRFQEMLEREFVLVDTFAIPNWWLNEDDMTIWEKKQVLQ